MDSVLSEDCNALYHHRGLVKTDIAATPPDHEYSIASLCPVPVKIVLQNCHHQGVKVYRVHNLTSLFQ